MIVKSISKPKLYLLAFSNKKQLSTPTTFLRGERERRLKQTIDDDDSPKGEKRSRTQQ